jgi:hypothetical protein
MCVQWFNQDIQIDKPGEELPNDADPGKLGQKPTDGFLKSLLANDGVQDKNYLWAILNRELTNKGNYLNIEGQYLSVKHFIKDWKTENMYDTLYSHE